MSEASQNAPKRFEGVFGLLSIARIAPATLLVTIEGHDSGEFGSAPMDLLETMLGAEPVELFIDARATKGASIAVSNDWALWLGKHRERFSRINMLTGSKFIEITATFVRNFSGLQETMRIYTDPAPFDEALREASLSGA
jgi:hypothetical protein